MKAFFTMYTFCIDGAMHENVFKYDFSDSLERSIPKIF